jgi:predicted nuclease of predicted toxin-antitoxin system
MSSLQGAPPHVVRLKAGNLSKSAMLTLLINSGSALQQAVEIDRRAYVEVIKAS